MADEGLHEIQLNGKQLVFLFMASTVVAVVIFLCGVMVGRGVRAQRPAEAVEASVDAATDPTASTPAPREPAPSSASIPSNAPVAANETLTYPSRLEGQEPVEETLKPGLGTRDSGLGTRDSGLVAKAASPKPEPAGTNDRRGGPSSSAVARRAMAEGPPEPGAAGEPAGNGFVVQVAAVNSRSEADAIASRLAGKGYPTFVTTPPGGVKMFRVRIGKYPSRREAETIAARLIKEDQFKPWITR
jgi:cell division septation protein DedD